MTLLDTSHSPFSGRAILSIICAVFACASPNARAINISKSVSETPKWESTPEYESTLSMVSAHAPLRVSDVVDADSASNRIALDIMIRKSLLSTYTPPPFVPPKPVTDSDIVGALSGRFSVDNKGSGNYRLDLPIPGGRGTPVPDLSLSYSSRTGNSSAGYRFYVSDGYYNAIARGRSFHSRDNEARGIELNEKDRFYLDGKRLLCVSDPEMDGLPGCMYRTEVDSFVTVEAVGTNNTIEGFVLRNKSGYTYYFGKFGDEEDGLHRGAKANDPTQLSETANDYALKRVENPFGYFVSFSYEQLAPGNWQLRYIDYTGTPELDPYYRIEYRYRSVNSNTVSFQTMTRTEGTFMIDEIVVSAKAEGIEVARYDFIYEDIAYDNALRLIALRPYIAADIGLPLRSLSPTKFYWSKSFDPDGKYTQQDLPYKSKTNESHSPSLLKDFDGDERDDILIIGDTLTVNLSDRNGLTKSGEIWGTLAQIAPAPNHAEIIPEFATGEFNGDSMADLIVSYPGHRAFALSSTGTSFSLLASLDLSQFAESNARLTLGDINGDGRDDIVIHTADNQLKGYLYQKDGFNPEPIVGDLGAIENTANTDTKGILLDLNGDGLDDYLWLELHRPAVDENKTAADLVLSYCLSVAGKEFSRPVSLKRWSTVALTSLESYRLAASDIGLLQGDFNGDDNPDFAFATQMPDSKGQSFKWEIQLNKSHPTNILAPDGPQAATLKMLSSEFIDTFPALETLATEASIHSTDLKLIPRQLNILCGSSLQAFDANLDGLDDLVWMVASEQNPKNRKKAEASISWKARYSNGDGTFSDPTDLSGKLWQSINNPNRISERNSEFKGRALLNWQYDTNGDGLNELVLATEDERGFTKLQNILNGIDEEDISGPLRNMVVAIVEGIGKTTCIAYRAAKDERSYTPGAVVEFPIRELRFASPVVTEVWKEAASGNFSQFGYQYSGWRSDFSGRGSLGFSSFTTMDRHTGFLSYQKVNQSFPVTGLVTRDEVYRTWKKGSEFRIKLISSDDYTPLFDAVTSPDTGRFFGTLYPYQSTHTETRWLSDLKYDYSLKASKLTDWTGSNPFISRSMPKRHLRRTVQSYWFDDQNTESPPPTHFPEIRFPYNLEPDAIPDNMILPGLIHYGNKILDDLEYGFGLFKKTSNSYHAPSSPEDTVTGLKLRVEESSNLILDGRVIEPPVEYAYVPGSNYMESKKTFYSLASEPSKEIDNLYEYPIDEYGRQTESYFYPLDSEYQAIEDKVEQHYAAGNFDSITDRPTSITYNDGEERTITYNRVFRKAKETYYARGITVFTEFDELGRAVDVSNPSYDYLKTLNYQWTRPGNESWIGQKSVFPPKGIEAYENVSVFAERVEESNELTYINYYDKAGNIIRLVEIGKDGSLTRTDTVFDIQGRIKAVTNPYKPDESITWNVNHYDVYGVVAKETKLKK